MCDIIILCAKQIFYHLVINLYVVHVLHTHPQSTRGGGGGVHGVYNSYWGYAAGKGQIFTGDSLNQGSTFATLSLNKVISFMPNPKTIGTLYSQRNLCVATSLQYKVKGSS